MCNCKNIIPQSVECYAQMIVLDAPAHMLNNGRRQICVDPCLSDEIQYLWSLEITTTGCCCGHNIDGLPKFIGVSFSDIPKMKSLGYKVSFNRCRPDDEDSFIAKSV